MLRFEHIGENLWSKRHGIVATYHKLHDQLKQEPFVTEKEFKNLTQFEWETIVDTLEEYHLI